MWLTEQHALASKLRTYASSLLPDGFACVIDGRPVKLPNFMTLFMQPSTTAAVSNAKAPAESSAASEGSGQSSAKSGSKKKKISQRQASEYVSCNDAIANEHTFAQPSKVNCSLVVRSLISPARTNHPTNQPSSSSLLLCSQVLDHSQGWFVLNQMDIGCVDASRLNFNE